MSESDLAPDKPHYQGHRARLRERFLKSEVGTLPDYEILELLLFQAQPRRDVKPLAKALIQRFGSLGAVISADPTELEHVKGMSEAGVAALRVVRDAAIRLLREEVTARPVLANWQALLEYCRAAMSYEKTECFHVLYLNRRNMLLADEMQQRGTVDHTPVYPRELVKRALEVGATALIMVHNHPSGDPEPSKADVTMTREVKAAGEKLGIVLHDHIIIARTGHYSFKAHNLL